VIQRVKRAKLDQSLPETLNTMLTDTQLLRYARHLVLDGVDAAGQLRLQQAQVLVVGAGGLGSPVLLYLAAAGVGTLVVSDPDTVELSNLQRQIVHDTTQLGSAKVDSAQQRLHALNPDVQVRALPQALSHADWQDEARAATVVVVCTDNHASRLAANHACLLTQTPWVYAAASGWSGQLACFDPRRHDSACFACLYPQHPGHEANCVDQGVVGPLVGVLGSLQALEAFKLITGAGTPLHNQILMVDTRTPHWQTLNFNRQAECVCQHSVAAHN